jgi:hypothetical protein
MCASGPRPVPDACTSRADPRFPFPSPDAVGTVRPMERRPDGLAIVASVWVAWIVVAGLFAWLLVLEHREVGVEPMFLSVSGCLDHRDSTNGVPHWQWDPPGTFCAIEKSPDIPHREVFNRPRAWRWVLLATLVGTLPLLIWSTVRTVRRDGRDEARAVT